MKLDELMKQRDELNIKLEKLNKQINQCELSNSVACCETIIDAFGKLDDLLRYESLILESYCEECETERNIRIEFGEIITAMNDLKNEIEKRIKREEDIK